MGWYLPFRHDKVSRFDVVLAVVTLVVIGGLVAWGLGWL